MNRIVSRMDYFRHSCIPAIVVQQWYIHTGKCLFEKPYFAKLKAALRPGGIFCSQGKTKKSGSVRIVLTLCHYYVIVIVL